MPVRTLLLIDNDASHAEIFADALLNATDGPFEGKCVKSLAEGIVRLREQEIWATFLNLSLPDSQGLETFDKLALAVPGIPILILAAAQEEGVALEALRHGAKDYLLEDRLERDSFVRAIRNMAERKTAEEMLFTEKERAQVTLDSIGDAVLSTDLQGKVTYLNVVAEKITGWTREEAAGKDIEEVFVIVDGSTREPCANPLRTAINKNRTVQLTPNCILIRRDGAEFAIEDSAAPIHDIARFGDRSGDRFPRRVGGEGLGGRNVPSGTTRHSHEFAQPDVAAGSPHSGNCDSQPEQFPDRGTVSGSGRIQAHQ